MQRSVPRTITGSALAGLILGMAALADPTSAAAHCGEHADTCGAPEWLEVSGGWCEDATDPYEYGTWMQPYEVWAIWCNRPIACVSTTTCDVTHPCGAGLVCSNGKCCPNPRLEPCDECDADRECLYSEPELPFEDDLRCWPWGIEASVPCAGPVGGGTWRNHGQYVSSVAHLLNSALDDGLVTEAQHEALMEAAGASTCGT